MFILLLKFELGFSDCNTGNREFGANEGNEQSNPNVINHRWSQF